MSLEEFRVRISAEYQKRRDRRAQKNGRSATDAFIDVERFRRNLSEMIPGARPDDLSRLKSNYPELYRRYASRALEDSAAIMSPGWTMLGHSFDLTGSIDWDRDPRTEFLWPKRFYADVPLDDLPDGVDFKYVWELGRQQYLVELARGELFGNFEGSGVSLNCGNRCRALLEDWIAANPMFEGVHWTSGLEVAMRAISWIWVLGTLADWNGWKSDDLRLIATSLAEHANYLESHFSFFSSPYNHLIGEATALFLIAQVLEGEADASRWQSKATKVLIEHAPKQFYGDGFCVEQATGYHFYTLGFLTLAFVASRQRGGQLDALENVIDQAYRAGAVFRQPDGRWPAIGDVDSARSIPVHHADFWQFDSICALGAVLFDEPDLKVTESGPGEELYWLKGVDGVDAWQAIESADKQTTHRILEDSGYVSYRANGDWLLFDAGPIAEGLFEDATPSTAHGHLDTLQVLFFSGGVPLLRDSGMPFYNGDPQWVRHFRSPAAHNTLEIEDLPLAHNAGPLAWSKVVVRPELKSQISGDVLQASGEVKWPNGSSVERCVRLKAGHELRIDDTLDLDGPRRVTWCWQVDEGAFVFGQFEGHTIELIGPAFLVTFHSHSGVLNCSVELPSDARPAAYDSEGYGRIKPACKVSVTTMVLEPARITTVIRPILSTSISLVEGEPKGL